MEQLQSGALLDERPIEEKEKDYRFEEIVATADQVDWREKKESEYRKFPIFNQDGSGSCVAQTAAKLLGILYWLKNQAYVHFSATHIYQRRVNKPGSGMVGVNCLDIMREGVTLEELVPSQSMSDAQMDGMSIPDYKKEVGKIFKIDNYVVIPTKNIETVASIIQKTGKAVMVWFYFTHSEWGRDVPVIIENNLNINLAARHSVTAVDYTIYQGKKALVIEDSWGPGTGNGGRRIITEDFFNRRNFFAAYPIDFKFGGEDIKPRYAFNNDMEYSSDVSYGNPDIIALQDCLKYLGLFPSNVESTGYFGSVTKKSVQAFQDKYGIAGPGDAGYGRVGPKTRAKLNELFNN